MRCFCIRLAQRYTDEVKMVYSSLKNEKALMRLRYSLLGVFVFCMAAHAFAFFNFAPVHDAVNYVSHFAGQWEVSLGRFLQPLYGRLRGEYTMPWFSGVLCMLYMGLASFLVSDLFELDNPWLVVISAGFLSANATMTNLIMSYSYVTDAFALALLLACAGAFAVIRLPNLIGVLLGSGCFAASMGIYQCYALFGGLLLVAYAMIQAAGDRRVFVSQAKAWMHYVLMVALTVIVYVVLCRLFLHRYGTEIASESTYNSPARLASMSLAELLPFIRAAYENFVEYFFAVSSGELVLMKMGNAALFTLAGLLFFVYVIREKVPAANLMLIVLGVLIFPGTAQAASILAQNRITYFLTAHALFVMYPVVLAVLSRLRFSAKDGKKICPFTHSRAFRACVYILCGCILFGNVRFSNEMYTFRTVQYSKTSAYVIRLMDRIESVPGYERNETEVVFTGYLSGGLSSLEAPEGWKWIDAINPITYLQVLSSYIYMTGEQMNIPLDYSDLPDYASMEEVQAMPAFPELGCCRMIDGRVLVKLTNH